MRKDTKTFLYTVLGIPLLLSMAWAFNAADEASVVVFQREHAETAVIEIPEPIEPMKDVPVSATVTPAVTAPKPKQVPVKIVAQPATVPPPVAMPVIVTAAEPVRAEPAPQPVTVKKSRRTRAS
jgi:hypothetical protein